MSVIIEVGNIRDGATESIVLEIDDENLSKLAIAIFNAKTGDLFGRVQSLVEKLKHLSIQSLF